MALDMDQYSKYTDIWKAAGRTHASGNRRTAVAEDGNSAQEVPPPASGDVPHLPRLWKLFTGFTPPGYDKCKRCFTFPGRGFPVIKNRVRELRQQKNVTQIQMARDLQITRQTLIAIERHKYHPSLELAFRIARYFGKRVDEVFLWEEDGD
jgi:putative transcriptional regulator